MLEVRTFSGFAGSGALLSIALLPTRLDAQKIWERPVVIEKPGTAVGAVKRTIDYGEDPEQKLDLYLPAPSPSAKPWPAVVFVHGGPIPAGMSAKNIGQFQSYGRLLSSRGIAAVAFNHRFHGLADIPQAAADIDRALGCLRQHAAEYSVDRDQLCVWTVSAGGLFAGPLLHQPATYLRCLVMYYGVTDPEVYAQMGMGRPPSTRFRVADQLRPESGPLPILVARAGKDSPALNQALDGFVQRAVSLNLPIQLLNHPDGPHAFDILEPDPRSVEIVEVTMAFVGRHLGASP